MRAKTATQQLVNLQALPLTTSATIKRGRLRWEGRVQPTPLSETYLLRIDYAPPRRPQITVVTPQLEIPEDRSWLPHVYPGERLCLCFPEQWDATKLIAWTLVPWASEWLVHYEVWKVTGDWHGGGHEPIKDRA